MKGSSASHAMVVFVAGAVALGSLSLFHPEADAEGMSLWEAYARGLVSITMAEETYQRGEDTVTLPVGIRVVNAAGVPVAVEEEAVLMSPHPSEPRPAGRTTQDGVLSVASIPAGGSLTYHYGEDVLRGFLADPPWWCLEEFQFTTADVAFRLGGETLPSALRPLLANRHYEGPESNTQADLWAYLRAHPAVVVGKDPLWRTVRTTAGDRVPVTLHATNVAVYTFDDAVTIDVNVTQGAIEDTVPAGWAVEEGSLSPAPDAIVELEDGSRTIRWLVDLPAALESEAENPMFPTEYETVTLSYVLVTPGLDAGRAELPRARSDMDGDGTPDAESRPALLDADAASGRPDADAGGPYAGVEGEAIPLDASASRDPDGDALEFRWDFEDDGTFETGWSSSPQAQARYTDDFSGFARVEARDATTTSTAVAAMTVSNAPPEIHGLEIASVAELRIAIAGERWHDLTLTILAEDKAVGETRIVREPGSPREQSATTGPLELRPDLGAIVEYTPGDDPANGGSNGDNPAWLTVEREGLEPMRFRHNFNVRHEGTWRWELRDLGVAVASSGLLLRAGLRDPGKDDLTATWDFGDGTVETQTFPADTAPFEIDARIAHEFPGPGSYRVRLVVRDDDGGTAAAEIPIEL